MMTIMNTKTNKGFTLVELMIAITISSVLMLGVSQIFSSSKRTYKLNTELARTQENIRYAVEEIARDVRMAGYTGCRSNTLTNTLNRGTTWVDNIGTSLLGYEGGVDTFPTEYAAAGTTAITGTDSILILRGGDDAGLKFDQKVNAANFKVNVNNHGLESGDILMLTDCSHTAVVQVTNVNTSNGTVVHQTGTTGPGNCTKGMGSPDCSGGVNGTAYPWNKSAHVIKFQAHAYYIAASVNGLAGSRSLYRMALDKTPKVAEELIEGVDNMQITYGYDSNGDDFANRYVKANDVSDFNKVVSIRIGLLFQSRDHAKRSINTQDFSLAGTTISSTSTTPGVHEYAEDNRLRFAINTVIKLRNKGIK